MSSLWTEWKFQLRAETLAGAAWAVPLEEFLMQFQLITKRRSRSPPRECVQTRPKCRRRSGLISCGPFSTVIASRSRDIITLGFLIPNTDTTR